MSCSDQIELGAMYEEDSTVQLISSKPKGGRGLSREASREQVFYLSDSELGNNARDGDGFEETTVFSDSLYGDSLPSMRAQLAATQMQNRSRKRGGGGGGGELEESTNEKKSLLSSDEKDVSVTTVVENSVRKDIESAKGNGQYNSLGGKIVPSKKKVKKETIMHYLKIFKIVSLTLLMVSSVVLFAVNKEHEEEIRFITLKYNEPRSVNYSAADIQTWKFVSLKITGPFLDTPYHSSTGLDAQQSCDDFIFICGIPAAIAPNFTDPCPDERYSNCHSLLLAEGYNSSHAHEYYTTVTKTLSMDWPRDRDYDTDVASDDTSYTVKFMAESEYQVEFQVAILGEILHEQYQVMLAAIILVWVYVLIGFDIVHRTMAAFIGSTYTLAVLSMIDKRPTLDEVVEWIDIDTICLLFGMMTLVAIFSQTGFFDYSAVKAYKLARGKIWPLITLLCLFSAVVSAFLDNVTTILLLTPVSIRLCQVLNLDPRPVLIAEVVFSNIGGTATAVGDPPNVIIVSNSLIRSAGINFPEFTLHLFLGIILAMVAAYGLLSVIYYVSKKAWQKEFIRDLVHEGGIYGTLTDFLLCFRVENEEQPHIVELKREVAIWERTAQRLNVVSLEERAVRDAILAKANDVRNQLNQETNVTMHSSKDLWQKNLSELESKYRITNWKLLIKSSVVLAVVIFMFFMSHVIPGVELELGWIAIFGGLVLLILADIQEDLETILHKIEWGTLLFFAGLFVLMEGLQELGLIRFIGDLMVNIIKDVPKEHQMVVAIVLILWVSAVASSFIDNIPFTTATIPVIWELASSPDLCVTLRPLVWALAFGACLGGNGTLIGASANVVCAGIAEQNGYKISFVKFFLIGFPMMLVTTFAAMIYLLICHEAIGWNINQDVHDCIAKGEY